MGILSEFLKVGFVEMYGQNGILGLKVRYCKPSIRKTGLYGWQTGVVHNSKMLKW